MATSARRRPPPRTLMISLLSWMTTLNMTRHAPTVSADIWKLLTKQKYRDLLANSGTHYSSIHYPSTNEFLSQAVPAVFKSKLIQYKSAVGCFTAFRPYVDRGSVYPRVPTLRRPTPVYVHLPAATCGECQLHPATYMYAGTFGELHLHQATSGLHRVDTVRLPVGYRSAT
jgi:hypothetical protein